MPCPAERGRAEREADRTLMVVVRIGMIKSVMRVRHAEVEFAAERCSSEATNLFCVWETD